MTIGSVRWRITALAAVITAVVLIVSSVIVVVVVQRELRDNLDHSLEQRADQVEAAVQADNGTAVANSNDEDRFVQVLGADGRVLLSTRNLDGVGPLVVPSREQLVVSTRSDIPIEDDRYRTLVRRFDVGGTFQYVVVGENVDDVRDGERVLIATLSLVIPMAVLVLAVVVWWLVGRTLRPVEEIRREVAGLGLDQLDRRVPASGSGDEIDRLADTMNEMLARLETSSTRERRFVADASHELRTPLTRMRTALEVELADNRTDLESTCRSVLDDTVEMQHLVDDLLFLARHDAGHGHVPNEIIDLDVTVADEVAQQRIATTIPIDMTGVSAAQVRGSSSQLARLVRNLVSNASRHAAGRVEVGLTDRVSSVVLVVRDDGPGVPDIDRERVFERFVRLDEARSGSSGGAGLGLAIARDIVTAHGGTIEMTAARVTVTLPPPETPDLSA